MDPDGRFDANSFYQFARDTSDKAQSVALMDSPAPGPCDIVAAGMLGVSLVSIIIGGGIDIYNYLADRIESRSTFKVSGASSANEQNQDFSAIRFQLQTGSDTPASCVRVSYSKYGVKKYEAYGALLELYRTAISKEPGLSKCKDFTSAIIRMSESVKRTSGTAFGGNVMRETFIYRGKEYRLDLENLRGINLVE